MPEIHIDVECHAGSRADERPRRFTVQTRTADVDEVLDRWLQVDARPGWPRAEFFRVRDADRREYVLKHDLESDDWFLVRPPTGRTDG